MTNWLTLEEAAEHLKMGRSTLYKLAQKGKMPGHKIGRAWRFDVAELDQWLKSGEAALNREPPKARERRTQEMKPPSLRKIEAVLQERRDELFRDYGVTEIGVFGSCVRGQATGDSDIDILVEFNRPVGFFKFLELEDLLSEWLGAKVDLVTKAALKPRIGRRILDEVAML
jgi:hypothetical protein